ncbi:MAG: hypothetical protein ACLQF0_08880 [Dissulfurispiraceae bacterium]
MEDMGMSFNKYTYLFLFAVVFLCGGFIYSSVSAEEPKDKSTLEKNKTEILNDIELFEHSAHSTRSCVSEAKTPEELRRCPTEESIQKYQRIQDDLLEIGMTPDERRMFELRPQR